MQVLNKTPLTIGETVTYIPNLDERKDLNNYFKKFGNLSVEKAKKLRAEIKALNNIKLKEEHIAKIVDVMPADTEALNVICSDIGLTEEEAKAILDIVKAY